MVKAFEWGPEHWDVDPETGCWEWNKSRKKNYGFFRDRLASRYALSLQLGRDLKPGECALHSCDNPPCVNPDHLHVGTKTLNAQERDERGRHAKANYVTCVKGHDLTKPENTYPRADRKKPRCRACSQETARSYYARKTGKAA